MDLLESVQEENNIENIPGHRLTENLLPLLRLQKLSHRFLCFRQNDLASWVGALMCTQILWKDN